VLVISLAGDHVYFVQISTVQRDSQRRTSRAANAPRGGHFSALSSRSAAKDYFALESR